MAENIALDALEGWYHAGGGVWRNRLTGETWRGWRRFGQRAGHYPSATWAKQAARRARATEARYATQLRGVARTIGDFVKSVFDPGRPDETIQVILDMLDHYRDTLLTPWAEATVSRILTDIDRRDAAGWHSLGLEVGRALRKEVEGANTAPVMRKLYDQQIAQIRKLPDDASARLRQSREISANIVRELGPGRQWEELGPAGRAMVAGRRWEDLVQHIRDTGLVIQSSANTVARTETARAHTTLQAVRAEHINSPTFQWITAGDADVRPLHKDLARGMRKGQKVGLGGGVYRWDDPPLLDDDRPGLPGTIYNCFPGDTLVDPLGGYRRIFRTFYRGSLVVLCIANPARTLFATLRVTPNHPILTTIGWVAARSLQKGDYVLQAISQCCETVEQNIDHRLLTFSEIFETGTPDVEPLAKFDFYGDAVENEVEIVWPQWDLTFDREATFFERLGKNMVASSDSGIAAASVVRRPPEVSSALGARSSDPSVMLFSSLGSSDGLVDLDLAAHGRTIAQQHPVQRQSTDAIFDGEGVLARASDVALDDFQTLVVTKTGFEEFVGHVYTLETVQGYYAVTSARAIAKNCRCYAMPILAPLPE